MNTSPVMTEANDASGYPEVSFGRSADGCPVARLHDTAFAMLPGRNGRHYLGLGGKIADRSPSVGDPTSTAIPANSPTRRRFASA